MRYNIFNDPRMEQVIKIVESIVNRSMFANTEVLLTTDNNLVIVVDSTVLYAIPLKDIVEPCPEIGFKYSDIAGLFSSSIEYGKVVVQRDIETCNDIIVLKRVKTIYMSYISAKNNTLLSYNDRLLDNEEYLSYTKLKSAEGMKYFKMYNDNLSETYFIPVFSGFPTINSGDDIGIRVYDLYDGNLMVNYTLYKKKISRNIEMFFRILRL